MKYLNNPKLLDYYIEKFSFESFLNENLINCCELHYFDKKEFICNLNKRLTFMYFLVKGKAKVFTEASNGKSLLLCFNTPLSVVGDIEVINSPIADCNVLTLEPCTCIAIPFTKLQLYGFNDPNFLRFIISSLGEKLRKNSTYSSINMLYPLENRFASYLLSILPSISSNSSSVEIEGVNHVSELLGSSYRHLNRIIFSMIKRNIISKNQNIINIIDIGALKHLAEETFII